jgi:hypothetical protein
MPEERVIQVFCDGCSRGVLVWRESMYKCTECGKQVCHACFDTSRKQCIECSRPAAEAALRDKALADKLAEDERLAAEHRRKMQSMVAGLLTALGFIAAAALLTWLLLSGTVRLGIPGLTTPRHPAAPAASDTIR